MVDYFDKTSTFDYMEPNTSAMISKCGYADPCTLVVALVYLDRLRVQKKAFFESTDPVSLYVPALVLASKYMHDADTYDRVSNSEWAESLKMTPEDLNAKEWNLVKNLVCFFFHPQVFINENFFSGLERSCEERRI